MLEKLLNSKGFSLDCETTSATKKKKDNLHFKKNEIVCISFANDEVSFCLATEEIKNQWQVFKELMTNPKYRKVGHNLKFDCKCITGAFNIEVKGLWFDTHIAACLLDENEKHGLKPLCEKYLKETWGEWSKDMDLDTLKEYCRLDSVNTYKLAKFQKPKLANQKLTDLMKTEMEVVDVFYKAEIKGVKIEKAYLNQLHDRYARHSQKVNRWVQRHTQEEFNINSAQQLCKVLYEQKKLPILKKTPAGKPSTDTRTLKELAKDGHRFADSILLYRHWEMLRRHIEKLLKEEIDGRIYPTFNTIGTETGRFSCKEPNLQQIPSKTGESLAIRRAFTGNLLVADYSNVELRLLAHFTRDPKLLQVYQDGGTGDLHEATAHSLGITRAEAKTINFGICYGMGPQKLAESLNIDHNVAKEYIYRWYKTYNLVEPWKRMICNTAKKYGWVKSLGGRKRRIDFGKLKFNETWKAEREIVNFVIQGSSADVTKLAIAQLKDESILMQVHDELVIDMDNSKRSVDEIKIIMEGVVDIRVPLTVDCKLCTNWSEGK